MADKIYMALDYSPDHAAALGRLLGHWAILETKLTHLLELLLGVDQYKARFIYQEFVSAKSKITLLQRLNHHFTQDELCKKEINKLLIKASKLNSKRNAFIHARWGIGAAIVDVGKLSRISTMLPRDYKKYHGEVDNFTSQDIQYIAEEIATLSLSFQTLLDRVSIDEKVQP